MNYPKFIPAQKTNLSEAEGAYALAVAWKRIYGTDPSDKSLAVLWAKVCLETGRFSSMWNYNFGNIKRKQNDEENLFTMYECGEEVSLSQAQSLVAKNPDQVKIVKTYSWGNGSKRASIVIQPGHPWSQFIAHHTVEDGAEFYLRFVSQKKRYLKAWQEVIKGDPRGYSHELKVAGYYTADEERYTAGVVRLFDEFLRRKEELMSWRPDDHDTDPAPPPVSEPEHDTDLDVQPPDPIDEEKDTEVDNPIPEPETPVDTELEEQEPSSPVKPDLPVVPQTQRGNELVTVVALIVTGLGAIFAWLFGF